MLFDFPYWLIFALCLAMTAAYFVMLTPRFDLRLWAFLTVSGIFTAVQIVIAVILPSGWSVYGLVQCGLFDAGAAAHLLNGKRSVRDVVGRR